MPVARPRFRTTVAVVSTGREPRRPQAPTAPAVLIAAALACFAAHAADAVPATRARRLLTAGREAAERGWLGAARDHWQDAADAAQRVDDAATWAEAVSLVTRLDDVARDMATAASGHRDANAAIWSAADWRPAWRVPEAVRPAAAGLPTVAGGLVVWNSGRGVHAVRLADGGQAWPVGHPHDTLLFPRDLSSRDAPGHAAATGRGPHAAGDDPLPVAVSTADRGFAVLDGDRLVCLDLSDAAQGRLVWSARAADVPRPAPRQRATFASPPTVDDDLCAVMLLTDDGPGGLAIAVFDARDGSLRWSHDLGPAIAIEDRAGPRLRSRPCFIEDRVVIQTLTGAVRGFDRAGTAVWTAATSASPAGGRAAPGGADMLLAVGRLILRDADEDAITAFEPRRGGRAWRWQAGETRVVAMLGTADGGLLIATQPAGDDTAPTTLLRLSLDDGRQTAARTMDGTHAGIGLLADSSVFWPVGRQNDAGGDTLMIELLDAGTLDCRRPPIDCGPMPPAGRGGPAAGHGARILHVAVTTGSIVLADDGITCLRPASGHATETGDRDRSPATLP